MKQGFFYIVKDEFFDKFEGMGCKFKYNKRQSRPTYCCFEDIRHEGLFWAIPTGSVKNKNLDRIKTYMALDGKDVRSSFYHIGYTNRKAIFYISSAFPVTDKYILREYTTNGMPLELKRSGLKSDIRRKLLKILTYENQFPNNLEPHITTIKSILLEELKNLENT
ncbi:MAG: hypothetical protein IJT23_01380 [Clostridia bacterium]|nr:hypothetical protein [Clostridia bacterium]